MVVKEHEKPLMQLMVLCKLGPAAPEVHLTTAIVVHFNLIWSSSSRFFVKDSFTKLTPVHELGKLQWNTLLLTALSTSNNEERESLDKRRRRGVARSSACTLGNIDRWLGLYLLPKGRPRRRFMDADDDEATREASFGLFLLPHGRPRPRFPIRAPVSRSTTRASAIGRLFLAKRNPRRDLEEEDDAAEKAHNEGITVFPSKLAYFIYK
jgi:hypothetical protein